MHKRRDQLNRVMLDYFDQIKSMYAIIPLREDMPDTEHPSLRWAVYAMPETDELAVVAHFSDHRWIEIFPSPSYTPPLMERILRDEIQVDLDVAQTYSRRIWRFLAAEIVTPKQ